LTFRLLSAHAFFRFGWGWYNQSTLSKVASSKNKERGYSAAIVLCLCSKLDSHVMLLAHRLAYPPIPYCIFGSMGEILNTGIGFGVTLMRTSQEG
jgi:hypothetical protein